VMGVVGAQVDPSFVLLTGIAGLLSGSMSMAAGEYISVTSQRELVLGEIRLEREQLAAIEQQGDHELGLLPEAETAAAGDDDTEIAPRGAARRAALSNSTAFVGGAIIPVLPFAFLSGSTAVFTAMIAAGVALFFVGAALSVVTGRPAWFAGLRQLLIGSAAATATFLVGSLVGAVL
jgi:vacuolar iron transporter family protein